MSPKSLTRAFLLAALIGAVRPSAARGEWFVTPLVGVQFSGNEKRTAAFGVDGDDKPWNVGVNGGWTKGWLGVDGDLAYHPRFFGSGAGFNTERSLLTAFANGRVTVPGTGWLKPYGTAGIGLLRPNLVEAGGLASVTDHEMAWNAGGGATGFLGAHLGLTGDVRYIRAKGDGGATNAFGIDFTDFDYVRASAGVTFHW